jgi:hypothetical protein
METKYLIFDCSTEHDSLVAIVDWTPEMAKQVLARTGLACEMKAADDQFAGLQFFSYDITVYRVSIEDLDPAFEEQRWVLVTEEPKMDPTDKERLDVSFLYVDHKAFYWEVHPRHSGVTAETEALSKDTEGLFD